MENKPKYKAVPVVEADDLIELVGMKVTSVGELDSSEIGSPEYAIYLENQETGAESVLLKLDGGLYLGGRSNE